MFNQANSDAPQRKGSNQGKSAGEFLPHGDEDIQKFLIDLSYICVGVN